jgi:cytochrome P450
MLQLESTPISSAGFAPASPEVLRDPYPFYDWLLKNDPIHRGAEGIWYVTRYADVRAVMSDPRFGRAGIRDFWSQLVGPGPLSGILRDTIFFQDDPDHARLRAILAPAFAPRVVRALQPEVERIVDELVRPLARRGHFDVVNEFAYPLALTVIAHVLGLPPAERAWFRAWSVGIAPTLDLVATPQEVRRGHVAMGQFVAYLRQLIARRERAASGGDDLLSVMLAARDDGAKLTTNEIISTIITLVFAGHDTVTNLIGNGVLALVRHPDQLARLRQSPELIPGAVEEILRYDSSVQSNSRLVAEDLEFGGRQMRRGEVVVALVGAANRDPAQFADPGRFDVTRTDVQPMSFGAGMRFCLGAVLGRIEARAAFTRLVDLDGLRLAVPDDQLRYLRSTMFRGVESLPVAFTATEGSASV